jgi:ATP-dependent protease HslVU (ClpYQ) peptidase subunit
VTTIVGLQGDGFAMVCVDSRVSEDNGGRISTLREGSTKVAVNGKYLIGAAGDVRAINILHYVFNPPAAPPNLKGRKLDGFMTQKFVPALRECFESQGYASPDSNEEKRHIAEHDSTILVVVNGVIYVIDGDYSWTAEQSGHYAIGSGSDYAIGAITALLPYPKFDIPSARKAGIKALTIAAKFDPGTGAPFHWFIQESTENKTPVKKVPQKKARTKVGK